MTTHSISKRKRVILLVSLLISTFLNVLFITAESHDIIVSGKDWLYGEGVDIYNNDLDFFGYYQCVELARRLYDSKGWPMVKTADGGAKSIPEGSPGLESFKPGSGYIPVPGDLIIEGPTTINAGYGHVAVVDYVEDNNIYAVEQNGARDGRVIYTYNGSNYGSGAGRGEVIAIVHAPQNNYKNPVDEESTLFQTIHVDLHGYSLSADISGIKDVSKIKYSTWNDMQIEEQGIVYEEMITLDMHMAVLTINILDFGNIRGEYYNKIEIYDTNEEIIYAETIHVTVPILRNIAVAEADHLGYTIVADIEGKDHVDKIEIHSYSLIGGNEYIVIDEMEVDKENIEYRVDIADHGNETGRYSSTMYVYDKHGHSQTFHVPLATVSEITDIEIKNQSETGYLLSAHIVNPYKIKQIEIETYTKQDGFSHTVKRRVLPTNNMLNIIVLRSSFSDQLGEYINTIHVTDIHGIKTSYKISAFYE